MWPGQALHEAVGLFHTVACPFHQMHGGLKCGGKFPNMAAVTVHAASCVGWQHADAQQHQLHQL